MDENIWEPGALGSPVVGACVPIWGIFFGFPFPFFCFEGGSVGPKTGF